MIEYTIVQIEKEISINWDTSKETKYYGFPRRFLGEVLHTFYGIKEKKWLSETLIQNQIT